MKRRVVGQVAALVLCAAPWLTAAAKDTQLNVYNWSDYIAKDTIPNFTKQSGVQVKYDNYDSDDTLQAKLLTGNSGYDIVVPTSNYAGKQIAAGIFAPLDKSKLPNLKYLDPSLMALVAGADPGNKFTVPWAYGTTGLGYNVTKAQQILGKNVPLDNWDVLFKPENISKLKACGVSVLDAPDQMFAAALHYIGKDPMSTNPADYREALAMLKKIRPYITQFNSSGYINDLVGGRRVLRLRLVGRRRDRQASRDRGEEAVQDRVLHSEGRRARMVRRDGDSEGREEQGSRARVDQLHRNAASACRDHQRRLLPERESRSA
ncbi:spermidine/putrescine-binding protein [Burkholderia sp. OAS925]